MMNFSTLSPVSWGKIIEGAVSWRHVPRDDNALLYGVRYPNGVLVGIAKFDGGHGCQYDLWSAGIVCRDGEVVNEAPTGWLTEEGLVAFCDSARRL